MRNVLSEMQSAKPHQGVNARHPGEKLQQPPGHLERINVYSARVEWSDRVVGELPQMDPSAATALDKAGLIFVRDLVEKWDADALGLLILPGMGAKRFELVKLSLRLAGLLIEEPRRAA